MRRNATTVLAVVLGVLFVIVPPAAAQERLQPRPKGEPIFLHWLNPKVPRDRVILEYWSKVKAHKASAAEMLDLGTMLYEHGFSQDAIRIYHRAGKAYPKLAEPWFLAGLVEHQRGHLRAARRNYRHCLKVLTGNGWCNFYMGLAEEQLGDPFDAMHFYDRAFRFDPGLADPKVNPEILMSKLQVGALVRHLDQERFAGNMPVHFFEAHGPQGFKSGPVVSAKRRRALETPHGAAHAPKKTARPRRARGHRQRSVHTIHPLRKAHSKKPAAHARGFRPKYVVKVAPGKPTPTPNPNRMPWGSAWRPSRKTKTTPTAQHGVRPHTHPVHGPGHARPKPPERPTPRPAK